MRRKYEEVLESFQTGGCALCFPLVVDLKSIDLEMCSKDVAAMWCIVASWDGIAAAKSSDGLTDSGHTLVQIC